MGIFAELADNGVYGCNRVVVVCKRRWGYEGEFKGSIQSYLDLLDILDLPPSSTDQASFHQILVEPRAVRYNGAAPGVGSYTHQSPVTLFFAKRNEERRATVLYKKLYLRRRKDATRSRPVRPKPC